MEKIKIEISKQDIYDLKIILCCRVNEFQMYLDRARKDDKKFYYRTEIAKVLRLHNILNRLEHETI